MNPTAEIRQRLQEFAIARRLDHDVDMLDALAQSLHPASYDAGHEIVRKGDAGSEAFFLIEGAVEIVDFTVDDEPYVKAVLDESLSVLFGELALVGSDVRTATVRARTACSCWVLERDDFLRLGEENPHLGWLLLLEIARLVSERLRRTNQDVLRLFEALVMEVESDTGTR